MKKEAYLSPKRKAISDLQTREMAIHSSFLSFCSLAVALLLHFTSYGGQQTLRQAKVKAAAAQYVDG